MKKIWKVLGIAAVAATVPVMFRRNRETGESTIDALLWQLKSRPNGETGKRDFELNILPNRLRCKIYTEVPEEELIVEEVLQPECDIELTLEPKLDNDEPVAPVEPAAPVEPEV